MLFHQCPAEGPSAEKPSSLEPRPDSRGTGTPHPGVLLLKERCLSCPAQSFPGLKAELVPGLGKSGEEENFSLPGMGGT